VMRVKPKQSRSRTMDEQSPTTPAGWAS
jgi:hypothetical protein